MEAVVHEHTRKVEVTFHLVGYPVVVYRGTAQFSPTKAVVTIGSRNGELPSLAQIEVRGFAVKRNGQTGQAPRSWLFFSENGPESPSWLTDLVDTARRHF
jgi:hypothetical protein